jgi:hypothetical protein
MRAVMRSVPVPLLLAAALLTAGAAAADEPGLRRYVLPNGDTLELRLPAGWADELIQPEGGGPPTIEISLAEGEPRQVFVTPEWPDPVANDVRELPALRDAVRELAERIQREAVESYLEVRQLNGANGVGYYFAATDRNPAPGEFKFMNQGALQVGSLTVWFTILTNDGDDTVAVEALGMLQAAVHRRTGHDQL